MSAYCDDDITATEPFSQYAASATPAQLVDLLFAHCHPEQILGVWKLLRECFDPASADPGAACLFEPLAPKPPALHLVRRELEAIALGEAEAMAAKPPSETRRRLAPWIGSILSRSPCCAALLWHCVGAPIDNRR